MVTTEGIAGFVVERVLGMVWGEGHSRELAVADMTRTAQSHGGNAVVASRWGADAQPAPGDEVERLGHRGRDHFVYGTAVVVRPAPAAAGE